MSMVVERGEARCPRCMVLADYRFHESDDGLLRYEVTCQRCGNHHFEDCFLEPADAPAA